MQISIARTTREKYKIDVADRLLDYKSKYDQKILEKWKRQVDDEIKMLK